MNELLVIAYAFPPCSVTGTYRTLAFVKYLEQHGWRSTVLCAENPIYPERDERLLHEVPAATQVIRTVDIDWLTRLQRMSRGAGAAAGPAPNPVLPASAPAPDRLWRGFKRSLAKRLRPQGRCPGWYRPALRAGRRALRQRRLQAIYSSGPPWTAHFVARRLAREFALPWIADFRDPWLSNPFLADDSYEHRHPEDEHQVVTDADLILCVLETMRADFLSRYPRRTQRDVLTIPNGFDPASFASLGTPSGNHAGAPDRSLSVLHAGQVYGRRRIEPLLKAITAWRQGDPALASNLELQLLGGNTEHAAELEARVTAAQAGQWTRIEAEVPHEAALERMADAAVLLLVGFTGRGEQFQMSAKIFEYLAVRRPVLALAPPSCPVGDVLRASGVRHWIVSPDDPPAILQALREIGAAWKGGELAGPQSKTSLSRFDRREQASELAALLDRLVAQQS